jgi:uncharacterized protein YkwD
MRCLDRIVLAAGLVGLWCASLTGCTGFDLPSSDGSDWWDPGGGGGAGGGVESDYCEPIGAADTAIQQSMLQALNGYRVASGLDELLYSDTLEEAADFQARDMYARGFFDHTNPEGEGPMDRAVAAGFCSPRLVGENIAYGQQSVSEVQAGWQNSPGHNANMLRPDFVFVGMGHYAAPSGTQYWVQLFGTPFE